MGEVDKTNILIVDDLVENHLVYRTILQELGQNLIFVRSGAEALRQVLQHELAVILLDVNMPDMDGLETAAMIRQRRRSAYTPIIFITAFPDDVRAAEGYAHGAVDYIFSPVVPEVLRAKVRVFVDLFRMTQTVKRQAEERIALAEERSKREAAEDSNRGLSFLARACDLLGKSLDYEVTARDLARLPVPFLADWAAVFLPLPGQSVPKIIRCTAEGERSSLQEQTGWQDLPEELAAVAQRALSRGTAELWPVGFSRAEATTVLMLPLQARGHISGVLVLSRQVSGRSFGPAELSMAETLVSRAAVALDNAQLYQDVQEADRQKNEFLSMLAHELRNPLAPIRNAAHVLRLQGQDAGRVGWAQSIIERQVDHMVRLVDDLLDISRITRGKITLKLEPVEMAQVVSEAVEACRPVIELRRHHLEVAVAPDPLPVNGDVARLVQILTNLLNNAAKYTEEGGRIRVAAQREQDSVVVRVRDTGVGISPEMLSAVFNLFIQADCSLDRSQGGLGIGLTLVRRLVEMHGGTVQAHSEGLGHGSEFVVSLPALAAAGSRPVSADNAERPQITTVPCRVLVVDDNKDGAETLAILLRMSGAEVHVVHDGPAALVEADIFHPEMILLDIGLPGMNGYEVAQHLRKQAATRNTLLVAITGYGQEEDRIRSQQAGFDHHLIKPIDLETLHDVLATLSRQQAAMSFRA